MHCTTNTLLKTAGGLGLVATVAYFTQPQAQAFILASAPLLLLLVCPLSMFFMMKSMNAMPNRAPDEAVGPEHKKMMAQTVVPNAAPPADQPTA